VKKGEKMATYFCSDLHGQYYSFCRLLDKISFSAGDTMYVLGDFIDKGKNSLRLAALLMETDGVKALLGNHEYYFLRYYSYCVSEYAARRIDDFWQKMGEYFPEDADKSRLSDIADYIETLPYYYETDKFICVHAGLKLDENGAIIPMSEQDENYMLFDRHFKEPYVQPIGKTVLFGHTPCSHENGDGRFIKTLKRGKMSGEKLTDYAKIRLDTGAASTGMAGCLRQEDMREFYVKSDNS